MNRVICAFVVLLIFVAAPPVSARGSRAKPKAPELHLTTIQSVTPTSLTIVEDKVTKSFAITQFTEVTLNGQHAAVTDLQPGMAVTVTLGRDPATLSRVAAGPAPIVPVAPKH